MGGSVIQSFPLEAGNLQLLSLSALNPEGVTQKWRLLRSFTAVKGHRIQSLEMNDEGWGPLQTMPEQHPGPSPGPCSLVLR